MSLMTPLARSSLVLVFLWCAEPTTRHEPMLLTKARNNSLVNLAAWSTTTTSGNPAQDRRHMSRMIAAASVAVAVEYVGTACTFPDSRWTWFGVMSKSAAR